MNDGDTTWLEVSKLRVATIKIISLMCANTFLDDIILEVLLFTIMPFSCTLVSFNILFCLAR